MGGVAYGAAELCLLFPARPFTMEKKECGSNVLPELRKGLRDFGVLFSVWSGICGRKNNHTHWYTEGLSF